MPAPDRGLSLLLGDPDDGKPTLQTKLPDNFTKGQRAPVFEPPQFLTDFGADPNDLSAQRWGVIAPDGPAGDRLLQIIDPLIKHRQDLQGGRQVRILRVPANLNHEEASRWRRDLYDPGPDGDFELPRYQLILGDLDQVGLVIQQVMRSDCLVGRLAFDDEQGYAAYVDKVLRCEKSGGAHAEGRAAFFTVQDQTDATLTGYQSLIRPGLEIVRKRQQAGQFPARQIQDLGDQALPARDELMKAAADDNPSVLFTLSHGAGMPRQGWKSAADQRARQGAMIFGHDGMLTGSDLAQARFLPGGIWFMVASYSAGTPDASPYHPWLERLREVEAFSGSVDSILRGLPRNGDRPFIAKLPQAVLQNQNGPLAFIGQVDLAWTHRVEELDGRAGPSQRPARFMAAVRSLLRGDRCGIAFHEIGRFFAHTSAELAVLYDRMRMSGAPESDTEGDPRRGHLWMLRHDLASYILLGDPAVRLPLRSAAATREAPQSKVDMNALFGFPTAPPPRKP